MMRICGIHCIIALKCHCLSLQYTHMGYITRMSADGSKQKWNASVKANKEKTLDRLSRLEGQVRGVSGMVEADRYCMDILAQTAAIRSAILGVEKLILENHAEHCVETAIQSGDPEEQRAKFDELIGLLQKASK
jgi:DNA-binding FrmR family transcriptional regulator